MTESLRETSASPSLSVSPERLTIDFGKKVLARFLGTIGCFDRVDSSDLSLVPYVYNGRVIIQCPTRNMNFGSLIDSTFDSGEPSRPCYVFYSSLQLHFLMTIELYDRLCDEAV